MRTVFRFPRLLNVTSRIPVVFVTLFVGIALIIGCGGGGGGSATTGTTSGCTGSVVDGNLTYFAEWVDSVGQSQLVRVLNSGGSVVASQVINRNGGNSAFFPSLTGGKYVLEATLFAQPDGAGSAIRNLRTQIEICGNLEVTADSGGSPNQILVAPDSVSMTELETRQLYAVAISANNRPILTDPNAFSWSISGGAATITSSGQVSAKQQGSAIATARFVALGLTAASNISVTAFNVRTGKWTILVFINAANDLYQFSDLNVNQMESVAQNQDVRFVLQWKQSREVFPASSFDGTRRYLVKPDTNPGIASELLQDLGDGIDMGIPETLNEFITFGKRYFPAERYVLVVWNHGNGWRRSAPEVDLSRAVSYDDETGSAIQIWELNSALGNNAFDIVAWDASLMQMLEVAYEIRSKAKYVAGSEESPPGEGYPYDRIFQKFRDNPNDSTASLSNAFVTGMLAVPEYATRKITQSILDTTKLGAVASALDSYGAALMTHVGTIGSQVQIARANSQAYSPTGNRFYRDIQDVVSKINTQAGIPAEVTSAGTSLVNAVKAAVVHEGHNSNSPGSTGLSFDFSPSIRFLNFSDDYERLQLAAATRWDEWLKIAP